ncbi:MAG: hypothetical protein J6J04_01390 [Oscillospiraceae bacterium]|nr:hypothetical protein [Oscillospiraceae bacterium]
MMKYLRLLEIQPGGWLLLSLLLFFGDWQGLIVILGNVLLHETGHVLMLQRFRVHIRRITFDLTGLCICYNGWLLTPVKEFLCAAAGPCVGLIMSVLASLLGNLFHSEMLLLFAGAGVVLSGFNLLPARPLDGWRMLNALNPVLAAGVSTLTAVLILVTGIGLMAAGYGTALAFMGIILLMQDPPTGKRRLLYH